MPAVGAVAEVKVNANNFSAEFGRSAGVIVSASTKSGNNTLHGALWEFVRNEKFDANNFFSNAARTPRQPFKQNQFGFTLGGPVVIPKLYNGHNRTFFFVDYEGVRRSTRASSSLRDVPPVAFRSGDFSGYSGRIYDPRARTLGANGLVVSTPLPGNRIPASLLNPGAVATLGLLPLPNVGGPTAPAGHFLVPAGQPFTTAQYELRVDHQFSQNNSMFGRYSRGLQTNVNPGNFPGFIGGGTNHINNTINAIL